MAEVWERSDRVDGHASRVADAARLGRVAGSWDAIFANTAFIQFVLTDEVVHVSVRRRGSRATRTSCKSGSSREGGEDLAELQGGRVAAVNVFVFDDGRWRMVLHHGSPVATGEPEADGDGEN